jgi:hypothetical protein
VVTLGYFRLDLDTGSTVGMICFVFKFTLHYLCLTRMRSILHTANIALDRYDTMYAGDRSDTGIGKGQRRQFLNEYGFRFSTRL